MPLFPKPDCLGQETHTLETNSSTSCKQIHHQVMSAMEDLTETLMIQNPFESPCLFLTTESAGTLIFPGMCFVRI